MKNCLPDELFKISDDLNDAIYQRKAKERIMVLVKAMSDEESIAFIESFHASRFYRQVLNNQLRFVQDFHVLSSLTSVHKDEGFMSVRLSSNFSGMIDSLGPMGKNLDNVYNHLTSLNEDRLIFLLEMLRKLRASIAVAAESSHLPKDLLATLRMRLQEFDQRGLYRLACSTVAWGSPEESHFIAESEKWWSVALLMLRRVQLTCIGLCPPPPRMGHMFPKMLYSPTQKATRRDRH